MKRSLPIRIGTAAALVLGAAFAAAQMDAQTQPAAPAPASALPAAQPTGGTSQPAAAAPSPPPVAEQRIAVSYTDGKLAVEASNASLNEILREVSQKTGMTITGGVTDDRVFGSYGPSSPAVVLDALLEGTDSNMLLADRPNGGLELILTPRRGGATPPSPNAGRQSNEAEENSGGGYVPPLRPYQPPSAAIRGQFGPGTDSQVAVPGSAPGSDPGNGSGSKTPQEIYDQLQQTMQQQRHLNAPNQ